MNNLRFTVLLFIIFLMVGSSQAAFAQADSTNYRLGTGDTIKITVYQEDELNLEARVNTNGTIDFPLIGQLKLSGTTLTEAENQLDTKLRGDYLVDPRISISILSHRPYFTTGEVGAPGSYEYRPGMTVRQAIAIAGDFTARASRRRVFLIREADKEYNPEKVSLDSKIGPGDTITVKEAFF